MTKDDRSVCRGAAKKARSSYVNPLITRDDRARVVLTKDDRGLGIRVGTEVPAEVGGSQRWRSGSTGSSRFGN
jgi:hypothetical protein